MGDESLDGRSGGKGEIISLSQASLEYLRAYRPGPLGVCELAPAVQVVLPIPEWREYVWWDYETVTVAAGVNTITPIFTVPWNERAYLESVVVDRQTGDNLIEDIRVTGPPGYGSDPSTMVILRMNGANQIVQWPDLAARQTLTWQIECHPLLMEPGSVVAIRPEGVGVSESTFRNTIMLRRMKLIRALAP